MWGTMSRFVEHEKRRERILAEAAQVFIEDGYQGATYQKIAKRCGVSRTTLYQYFRNKQQIFALTIKQITDLLEADFLPLIQQEEVSPSLRLEQLMEHLVRGISRYRGLLGVVFDYLNWLEKRGENPREKVQRRTIRLRLTLVRLANKAISRGEFSPGRGGQAAEMLMALLEGAMLRMILGYSREPEYSLQTLRTALEALRKS